MVVPEGLLLLHAAISESFDDLLISEEIGQEDRTYEHEVGSHDGVPAQARLSIAESLDKDG